MTRELRKAARLLGQAVDLHLTQSRVPEKLRDQVRIYLLHMEFGVAGTLLAALNGCTKQNISKHVARIEAARDTDPRLDGALEELRNRMIGEG